MTDYQGIIERVRAATGADRELDADLAQAIEGVEIQWRQANGTMEMYPVQRYPSKAHAAGFGIGPVPSYTASIDAALGLVERCLPGWMWTIYHEYVVTEAPNVVFLKHRNIDLPLEKGEARGDHITPPLAIILATLLALQSQEAKK